MQQIRNSKYARKWQQPTRGFVQVWLDGISLIFCTTIQLQFQLDGTLLSKRIKHQLKPIHLVDVYEQTEFYSHTCTKP